MSEGAGVRAAAEAIRANVRRGCSCGRGWPPFLTALWLLCRPAGGTLQVLLNYRNSFCLQLTAQ